MTMLNPSSEAELRRASASLTGSQHPRVAELQARINGMQASAPPTRAIPTRPDLERLLPGGLRQGGVYQVRASSSLAIAAMAAASTAGRWTAWVGWPQLGAEALANAGIQLERTALVPTPREHWMSAVSTLADAMSVIAVRPPRGARMSPAETARIAARLRERGAALLIDGNWPGADAHLLVERTHWQGISEGYGTLWARELDVAVRDRSGITRRGRIGVESEAPRRLHAVTGSAGDVTPQVAQYLAGIA